MVDSVQKGRGSVDKAFHGEEEHSLKKYPIIFIAAVSGPLFRDAGDFTGHGQQSELPLYTVVGRAEQC